TQDVGRHWTRLSIPDTSGADCQIGIAPDAPRQLVVHVTSTATDAQTGEPQASCDPPSIFVSRDGGDSWLSLPSLPSFPRGAHACGAFVELTLQHLYLTSSYELASEDRTTKLVGPVFFRSDDGGHTWTTLDETAVVGVHLTRVLLADGQTAVELTRLSQE